MNPPYTRRIRRCLSAAVVIAAVAAAPAAAAAVTARLDRTQIFADESVRLVVESDAASGGDPDFSPLQQNFHILNTATSQQISITNGAQKAVRRWEVELEPRSAGVLSVPALIVDGAATPPLTLTVQPRPAAAGPPDTFMEVTAEPSRPYVQQQVVVTVRLFLFLDVNINGSLTEPEARDAVLVRLGGDRQYDEARDGRGYRVVERRYALFPQRSGTLTLAPLQFEGRGRGTRRLRAQSEEIPLEVQGAPPFPGRHWLPARRVTLSDASPPLPEVYAGQPFTQTVELRADGLTAEQLPELEFPTDDGYRVYPEQPQTDTRTEQQGVVGTLRRSVAVVVTEAGEFTLPPITVPWWNTASGEVETASLPAKTVQVLPPLAVDGTEVVVEDTPPDVGAALPPPGRPGDGWHWISLALLLGWVATALGWWRSAGRVAPPAAPPADPAPRLRTVRACAGRDDAHATRAALLAWARARWPQHPPRTLTDLIARFSHPPLRDALHALDRHLYAPSPTPWHGEPLGGLLAHATHEPADRTERETTSGLPPLYLTGR